jgi:hypothetical protein
VVLGVRDAFEAIKDEFKDALAAEKDQVGIDEGGLGYVPYVVSSGMGLSIYVCVGVI